MPRGKRAGSKMPTADYDAGCRVKSTSTKYPTRKSRTSSSPPISRPENALASRLLFRQFSKSLAKTCKSGSRKALLHLALESRDTSASWPFEVKRVQTIHRHSVDVARGLALPLGVGTKVFQHELAVTDWSNIHS